MYLGAYSLGDWVHIPVRSVNASGVVTAPTSTADKAPIGATFKASAKVENFKLPQLDKNGITGVFSYKLRLTSSYTTGSHIVVITYVNGSGGFYGSDIHSFQIVGGGDANGNVIAITDYTRPDAEHAVYQTDAGLLRDGRAPY